MYGTDYKQVYKLCKYKNRSEIALLTVLSSPSLVSNCPCCFYSSAPPATDQGMLHRLSQHYQQSNAIIPSLSLFLLSLSPGSLLPLLQPLLAPSSSSFNSFFVSTRMVSYVYKHFIFTTKNLYFIPNNILCKTVF